MSENAAAEATQTSTTTQQPDATSEGQQAPEQENPNAEAGEQTSDNVDKRDNRMKQIAARERRIFQEKQALAQQKRELEENIQYLRKAQQFDSSIQTGGVGALINFLKTEYNMSPAQIHAYISENHIEDILDHKPEPELTPEQKRVQELEERLQRLADAEEQRKQAQEQAYNQRMVEISHNKIVQHKADALAEWESDIEGETTGPELLWTTIKKLSKQHNWSDADVKENVPWIIKQLDDYCAQQLNSAYNVYNKKYSRIKSRFDSIINDDKRSSSPAGSETRDQKGSVAPVGSNQGSDSTRKGNALKTLSNDLPAADAAVVGDVEKMSVEDYARYLVTSMMRDKNKVK